MKQIVSKIITAENFQEYGTIFNVLDPRHPMRKIGEPQFYPDRAVITVGSSPRIGMSACIETRREKNVIEFAEIHHKTGEGMISLEDDVIIYTAPATEEDIVPLDYIEAFRVPRGTLVTLHPGIWHGCQFPISSDKVHVLIILPERTYADDCFIQMLNETEQIEIV